MSRSDWPGTTFITTAWLAGQIGAPDLAIIDASWYLPTQNRDARVEYRAGHIPGAVFFDIDAISDPSSDLPHMLPSPHVFGETMGSLGVGDGMRMVVYDTQGLYSAPRVWWTLRAFGQDRVAVLDGGLPQWVSEGRPLQSGAADSKPVRFTARPVAGAVADLPAVQHALTTGSAQVVDARSAARFRGEAPEPRAGLHSGHMPGSLSVPFDRVVEGTHLAPLAHLRRIFTAAGVDLAKPVITTCGSGVTAAVLSFALANLGKHDVALYDGSWSEWGGRGDLPVARGE